MKAYFVVLEQFEQDEEKEPIPGQFRFGFKIKVFRNKSKKKCKETDYSTLDETMEKITSRQKAEIPRKTLESIRSRIIRNFVEHDGYTYVPMKYVNAAGKTFAPADFTTQVVFQDFLVRVPFTFSGQCTRQDPKYGIALNVGSFIEDPRIQILHVVKPPERVSIPKDSYGCEEECTLETIEQVVGKDLMYVDHANEPDISDFILSTECTEPETTTDTQALEYEIQKAVHKHSTAIQSSDGRKKKRTHDTNNGLEKLKKNKRTKAPVFQSDESSEDMSDYSRVHRDNSKANVLMEDNMSSDDGDIE